MAALLPDRPAGRQNGANGIALPAALAMGVRKTRQGVALAVLLRGLSGGRRVVRGGDANGVALPVALAMGVQETWQGVALVVPQSGWPGGRRVVRRDDANGIALLPAAPAMGVRKTWRGVELVVPLPGWPGDTRAGQLWSIVSENLPCYSFRWNETAAMNNDQFYFYPYAGANTGAITMD